MIVGSIINFKPDLDSYEQLFSLRGELVVTMNPDLYVEYYKNKTICGFERKFKTTLDSRVVQLIRKIFFNETIGLVQGSDLIIYSFKQHPEKRYLVIGGSPNSNRVAVEKAKEDFGCANVIGVSPNVSKDGSVTEIKYLESIITSFRPDIVFVGLGVPKQELFMNNNAKLLRNNVKYFSIGVGGSVDFLSGTQIRAPKIFRTLALEWLWRLLTVKGHHKRIYKSIQAFL